MSSLAVVKQSVARNFLFESVTTSGRTRTYCLRDRSNKFIRGIFVTTHRPSDINHNKKMAVAKMISEVCNHLESLGGQRVGDPRDNEYQFTTPRGKQFKVYVFEFRHATDALSPHDVTSFVRVVYQ